MLPRRDKATRSSGTEGAFGAILKTKMRILCSQSDEADVDLSCLHELLIHKERIGCPIK